ncbi:hypothetical protein EDB81DRAFT_784625 [Dactylonectria macrodidyma]|uniref:Uncharacterized protein n=1 Tax=Dactylonectria macrodidyma TaxID=307937 RepID=A0A9P9FFL5_9HYPO|nr:hypothetical protein EDB81DRAFT_784625 [Dactylonectria macrodidyma]
MFLSCSISRQTDSHIVHPEATLNFPSLFSGSMMPGPPTPVSGCPLQRLEIRDGVSTRIYHTQRPRNVFTMTLEGERCINSKTGTLVLLIYNGQQQLVSIRLHDLLKNPLGSTNIISVEKQQNELSINIPGQPRAIIAQFEEKRDFSLAVYMLEKSNLRINDSITYSSSSKFKTASSPTDSLDFQTASNIGPRLSSITPLTHSFPSNIPYNLETQSDNTYASISNSPLPESPRSPWGQPSQLSHFQYPQRINSLPTYSSTPTHLPLVLDALGQQLNPYNLFLGRSNSQTHTPRVSSPLRQSYPPENTTVQSPSSSFESSPYVSRKHVPYNAPNRSPSGLGGSQAGEDPHHRNVLRANVADNRENIVPVISPFLQTPNTEAYRGHTTGDLEQSFRNLMPRPRKLPFDPSSKSSGLEEKQCSKTLAPSKRISKLQTTLSPMSDLIPNTAALPKTAPQVTALPSPKIPKLRAEPTHKVKDGCRPNFDQRSSSVETSIAVDESPAPQAALSKTRTNEEHRPLPTMELAGAEFPSGSPHVPETTVLVTDSETLKHLNELTSILLDQHEADVLSGIDEEDSARFYMDRIMAKRREFWLAKLEGGGILYPDAPRLDSLKSTSKLY